MARNRNPHETRRKILEVSKDLFLEKGFDNTSIQDIIDGLGGLTKGVIYHHFESKDEILQSIISENNQEILNYNWRGDTALEKIQNSLMDAFSNLEQQRLVYSVSIMLRSPRLLGEQYLSLFSDFLPGIREKVFEGVKDKSIKTEYPEELADLIVLTLNIWIGFHGLSKLTSLFVTNKSFLNLASGVTWKTRTKITMKSSMKISCETYASPIYARQTDI